MPFPFLLSTAAGLATLIGAVLAVVKKSPPSRLLFFALGFSGGVMTAVSLLDLLPHAVGTLAMEMPGAAGVAACICACAAGMLAARLLDLMVASGGDAHARLLRIGVFSMLALMLHNIPEGMAVYLSAERDIRLGFHLCTAIALHNIPEGIAVAMPVCAATGSRFAALLMAAVSGLAEPLGAVIAQSFFSSGLSERGLALIFSGIAGLMLATAFYELFPEAIGGKGGETGAAGALWGVIIMVLGCCISA